MKAPAFQFYPGDFLSSPDVQIMEAHEVGAYLLLLCAAWQSERPGYLPNDEGRLRRLARLTPDQWRESSALVLGKFPVQEEGEYRANKRMLTELDKQELFRQSRAEAGRVSAAKRAQAQQDANKNPTRVELKPTRVEETANKNPTLLSSSSSSSSFEKESTNVPALAPEKKIEEPKSEKPVFEIPAAEAPHTRGGAAELPPLRFLTFAQTPYATEAGLAQLAAELKLPDANAAYYLAQIALKAAREDNRTPEAWHTYAARWLSNDARRGQLITNTIQLTDNPHRHAIAPRNLSPSQRAQFVPDVTSYGTL